MHAFWNAQISFIKLNNPEVGNVTQLSPFYSKYALFHLLQLHLLKYVKLNRNQQPSEGTAYNPVALYPKLGILKEHYTKHYSKSMELHIFTYIWYNFINSSSMKCFKCTFNTSKGLKLLTIIHMPSKDEEANLQNLAWLLGCRDEKTTWVSDLPVTALGLKSSFPSTTPNLTWFFLSDWFLPSSHLQTSFCP